MSEQAKPQRRGVFTIGHSNHDEQTFVGLLQQHQIEVVADVRSQPYSKYTGHFNADQIKPMLSGAGIQYVFLGAELGGRPADPDCYDSAGHVLYDRVAASWLFLQGIERLEQGIRGYRISLMCSEEDPAECHRRLLVGRVLADRGIEVWHIRGDGRLQTEAEVRGASRSHNGGQKLLFPEIGEPEWRSTRSVSPKSRPPSSLES